MKPPALWCRRQKPWLVLAPMAGVTDAAYRRIVAAYGKPDAMWTEFVSADALCSRGRSNVMHDLWFDDSERPVIAQLYGCRPEAFCEAASLIRDLGFDGVDINMGCPAKDVEKRGAGAALIKDPGRAIAIVEATKKGAGSIPVSVKTRIGYRSKEIDPWLVSLIRAEPNAITIHARTRNEASKVPARWSVVKEVCELARDLQPDPGKRPLIIGNGDVPELQSATLLAESCGCDGVMLGRAVFGNPWLFHSSVTKHSLGREQVLDVLLEHTSLFIRLFDGIKPLEIMKKHYKSYLSGFDGATSLRIDLMAAKSYADVKDAVEIYRRKMRAASISPSRSQHPQSGS